MEAMVNNMEERAFWHGKKVLVTGNTGFKGSWLSLWLTSLGANVFGYSLDAPTEPNLFNVARLNKLMDHRTGDVRDLAMLTSTIRAICPDVVIHMAAQPLVRESYRIPVDTYATNVMGTVHVLEAIRQVDSVRAVLNVTTDKCYENKEWLWGYREGDNLGGVDPYSNSKACSELVTACYRLSFFPPARYNEHGVAVATARAGNVIGGGDWSLDRLVPDCLKALGEEKPVRIRNPRSIRPWQHVLEPLAGYLTLVRCLFEEGPSFAESWNFGPADEDARPVEWIVKRLCDLWGVPGCYTIDGGPHPYEATYLKLDCSKVRTVLGWHPVWRLDEALEHVVEWEKSRLIGADVRTLCFDQMKSYEKKRVSKRESVQQ